ncbi:zinc finger domain-containing protein [Nocardiopsis changdeensis]|uniref:DNA-binding phage zinc finger domain-containing protein n=1 Tax=Nocardiopsis changdeensis TaxID=2831969 RepID=A0ABX8BEW6_9ACTN|nr:MULTISPECIES: hypothetical protein [Nocardiopsis]QUX20577.1 hypothetical protein KGD84_18910 [Nocardiopsis changdeensis]QYX36508.1 hypothetical protein K1J57_28365 [Nocardiopsis sp. MT53]
MIYPLAVVCPTCRVGEQHLCRTPTQAVRRLAHPRRFAAAAAADIVSALAPRVPPTQRWLLAQELVTAPDHTVPPAERATGPHPDLDAARAELDTAARTLEQLRGTAASAHWGVNTPGLVRDLDRALHTTRGLVEVLTDAARDQRIRRRLNMGATSAEIAHALLVLRAERVDAAVEATAAPAPPTGAPVWKVGYRSDGRFRLRSPLPEDGTSRQVGTAHGFAPTPAAAARAAAQFAGPGQRVVLDPPHVHAPRPLVESTGRTLIDHTVVKDLLEGDEPVHTAFLAACTALRHQLAGVRDLAGWWAERTETLQASHPQCRLPLGPPAPPPAHRDHADTTVEATAWVPAHLIVATDHPVWGRLDHKPEVPLDVLRALADTADVAEFTEDLFTSGDPVQLERITGWAGPVYAVAGDGNHRAHLLRAAGLPWAAAHLTHTTPPPVVDLNGLVKEDENLDGRGEEGRAPSERARHRMHLICGLIDRGVIDAWWDEDRPDLLWCRRLPAPWLLRSAEHATAANAVYEAAYPGALARLGIPDGVGTDAAAWRSWLTTPDSARRLRSVSAPGR